MLAPFVEHSGPPSAAERRDLVLLVRIVRLNYPLLSLLLLLLLLLQHLPGSTRRGRVIDKIGRTIFLCLVCQVQPRAGHRKHTGSNVGIGCCGSSVDAVCRVLFVFYR